MARWTFYHLEPKPGAGFHFGLRGLEQEDSASHCPSDTLFAALVATLADLDGDAGVRAFTKPFEGGAPSFLLTSLFPRVGSLSLFPLPFVRPNLAEQRGRRKLFKKLRYVSPAIFSRIISRQSLDEYADGEDGRGFFLQGGQVWIAADEIDALPDAWCELTPDDIKKRKNWRAWFSDKKGRQWLREQKVWDSKPVDRVTVDRASSTPSVFRIGRTVYAPGCGLWFGVQWPDAPDAGAQQQLELLLSHLGDRGLGGERSVGYGQFKWHKLSTSPLDLPERASGDLALSLSRYLPRPEELPAALQGEASYRLSPVVGWLNAPGHKAQRRKQVRMLAEGSVFQPVGAGPWGRLANVSPQVWDNHPIWRYGYACPVGIIRPQEVNDATD